MKSMIIGVALLLPTPAFADTLHLVCLGAGSASRVTQTFGSVYGSNGNSAWGNIVGHKDVPFDDQVNIELVDGQMGRIRMPRAMLPKIHGGEGGWFNLDDVSMKADEITATAKVNVLNHPKVRLDRLQGHISISGKAGDYSGVCQPYDPATVTRKF